jgi:3-hydroxyisobutyrate dehydrogenase
MSGQLLRIVATSLKLLIKAFFRRSGWRLLNRNASSSAMSEAIGFVGVGRMGANMARRLHACGQRITAVFDVSDEAASLVAGEIGAQHVRTLAAVTAAADLILTVVSDDAAQLGVFREESDSLLVGSRGKLFVNCATVSPKTHLEFGRRVAKVGAGSLEACMASSIPQARDGTLYLMCGGDHAHFLRAKPVLEMLSSSLRYIGTAGQAAQVKALVNMVMNINTAALAEGLGLASALGLDLAMVREVFAQTGANSQVLKTDGEDMELRNHDCFFSAAHAAKDSGIAWNLACETGLQLPLSGATKLQYERLVALGLGTLDKSGIAELTFKGRAT